MLKHGEIRYVSETDKDCNEINLVETDFQRGCRTGRVDFGYCCMRTVYLA